MKYNILHIALISCLALLMTGCYGYRQVGLLQEREDLPQYDSVPYEPYRLQVNDEVIYRVITMDETIAKTMSANSSAGGQYANSYRIYSDGTVDIPFLSPIKLEGLTELEAQDTLRKAMREIIDELDESSLLLMDETFSGTNSAEGAVIAGEVIGILQEKRSHVFFSTHLHDISDRIDEFNRFTPKVLPLSAEYADGKRTYRIVEGVSDRSSYALEIARRFGLESPKHR